MSLVVPVGAREVDSSEPIVARVRELAAHTLACRASDIAVDELRAGLGSRRFFRVRAIGSTAIARVELPEDPTLRPPGIAPEPALEPIRALLEAHGVRVPRRIAHASDIELLEDLGDVTLDRAVASGADRSALYARACEIAASLQRIAATPDVPNFARRLDAALFAYKADQVCRWLLPAAFERPATDSERGVVERAFAEVSRAAAAAPQRLAHRDFKAQNIHVLGEPRRCELALIDIQGAFLAPPEYDLVCLLRDLQVSLPDEEIATQLARVRPLLPDRPPEAELRERFDLLTLSRVGKDLARFVFALRERGDERYRAFLPNGVRSLQRAARDLAARSSAMADFAALVARIPESLCER